MIRRVRGFLRCVGLLLDEQRGLHFVRKLEQWEGSSWALEEVKAGHLHHVEFILENAAYDRDAYTAEFLRGARETLISMLMKPAAASYVREVEAALNRPIDS